MDAFGVEASGLSSRSPPTRSVTVYGETAPEAARPPGFDAERYKERNAVERCIARLRQWRGLTLRTDKLAITYQAALHVASILIRVGR